VQHCQSGIRLRIEPGTTDAVQPRNKGRIGTIMVTPPKLPANDSLPPLMRTVVISRQTPGFRTGPEPVN